MTELRSLHCSICDRKRTNSMERWYLLLQSSWAGKLKVLDWDENLGRKAGVHSACCPGHVRQLVVHWMATGSLLYPFANATPRNHRLNTANLATSLKEIETSSGTVIGELAIDPEGVQRALRDNPGWLDIILDELVYALESGEPSETGGSEEDEEIKYGLTGKF